ncbi:MAG: glycine cleavage system aminomethyltransferase GcvT [Actinomycetes bacterium]
MDEARHSPLEQVHIDLGAKLVPFGGWDMPIAYGDGTLAEHKACRTSAVVFDVSHLGTVRLSGEGAFSTLQRTLTNDLNRIQPGRAQYTHLLNEQGGVVDDIIVWWVSENRFDVMPNASNTTSARAALGGTEVTGERAVLAVQGPMARTMVANFSPEIAAIGRFQVAEMIVDGTEVVVAGTGYTGEDGLEIAVPVDAAQKFFSKILDAGVIPAGLGARDTLRLEAGLPLHGHELSPSITPLQANLNWVIGWNKETFIGRGALEAERRDGSLRRLVGIVTEGRQPPREGASIEVQGSVVGEVTSGNFSPMLGSGIAMGFIDTAAGLGLGDTVEVVVRGRALNGHLVQLPFWPIKER